MQSKRRRTRQPTPAVKPHMLQTLELVDFLVNDFLLNYEKRFSHPALMPQVPLVNALHGLATFIVFFLGHSKENEADTVAESLDISRVELDILLIDIVRARLFSLRIGTPYDEETLQQQRHEETKR